MPTPSQHENTVSDFLQLEPIATPGQSEDLDLGQELYALEEMLRNRSGQSQRPAAQVQELQAESQHLLESISHTKSQLADIERGVQQSNQLHRRTEQLAKYSKLQVQQLQALLQSFDAVRQDIVNTLDRFGGHEQLTPLLADLRGATESLQTAQGQLATHEQSAYQTLQGIQQQAAQQNSATVGQLQQQQQELQQLWQSISTDRERVLSLEQSVGERVATAQLLHQSLSQLQTRLQEQSAAASTQSQDLSRNFVELSESMDHEKQQFYQLTAEMINKTDAMRSQFAELAKQVSKDWEGIQALQFRLADFEDRLDEKQLEPPQQLAQRYEEIVASWGELHKKQQFFDRAYRTQNTWLKVLSAALGLTVLALIFLLFRR
jgi:uncharacterized phage infection (PIP) family protein YhgE